MADESRECPSCGYANRSDSRFCAGCGTRFMSLCSSCGKENQPGARFCDQCGMPLDRIVGSPDGGTGSGVSPPSSVAASTSAPVPVPPTVLISSPAPQEERRLMTALFCDLVGFTPLSEQLDPEDVREIQAQYFAAMAGQIERYGGTVEKYAGDAILALFGVPVAHEDDAERAVLCALGMQTAIEPVVQQARARWEVEPAIRVGVNTGEVVSGSWEARREDRM